MLFHSSFDGDYIRANVGEIRNTVSYQFEYDMDEIQAKMAKPKVSNTGVRAHYGSLFLFAFYDKIF